MEENRQELKRWLRQQYPLTIIKDRYGGLYTGLGSEGGYKRKEWIAFPLRFDDIPAQVNGSDLEQLHFLESYSEPFGVGETPEEAVRELEERMIAIIGRKV